MLNCFLLSPSLLFSFFYTGIYASIVGLLYFIIDFDEQERKQILDAAFIWAISALGVFFLLQRRELMRFYEQKKANKKEQQLSNMFNSQNDAVIVFQADLKIVEEASQNEESIRSSELKKVDEV